MRVCSEWFLNAIITDLERCTIQLAMDIDPHKSSLSTQLGRKAVVPAKNIFHVMEACRRLRSSPDLFPSDHTRRNFFERLSEISKGMREFIESYKWKDMYSLRLKNSLPDLFKGPIADEDKNSLPYPGSMGDFPYWHPLNVGQNVWNKWLENRCDYEIPPTESKIVQRLPSTALRIANRNYFMYEIAEENYEEVSRQALQIAF